MVESLTWIRWGLTAVPPVVTYTTGGSPNFRAQAQRLIQEYYRQMRKFGCNILAVVQQYDIIKDSAVRGAMIGNSKVLSTVGFGGQQKLAKRV
jgi:hypothetical protein